MQTNDDRHGQAASGWRSRRALALPALALTLALALTGYFLARRPAARHVAPTPAPTVATAPTPLPTPATPPGPVAYVTPTALPRPSAEATPAPAPPPDLRDAGELLYVGALDGQAGIIAVRADGGDRRLIVPGPYQAIFWSPDGRRFVAPDQADGRNRLTLFDAGGAQSAQFVFPAGPWQPPTWSRDSRTVAYAGFAASVPGAPDRARFVAWLVSDAGAVPVSLGASNWPWQWSTTGRLALTVSVGTDTDGDAAVPGPGQLWTVDETGHDARLLADGAYLPVGWSLDGATLYALGDVPPAPSTAQPAPRLTTLLAIDASTGRQRPLVAARDLAARVGLATPAGAPFWFDAATLAPTGDRFALELVTPGPDGTVERALVVLGPDAAARRAYDERAPAGAPPLVPAWSPDGGRLAWKTWNGAVSTGVRVYDLAGGGLFAVGEPTYFGPPDWYSAEDTERTGPQWSPDGRWIAFSRLGRLSIAAATPPPTRWTLAAGGLWPAWRP
ncbi:MAG TPA: hypothetical protein VFW96_07220 [Thermomicrobiales bacterium]|nr:hypothetical protein [Thermomicrobiales bacterium]